MTFGTRVMITFKTLLSNGRFATNMRPVKRDSEFNLRREFKFQILSVIQLFGNYFNPSFLVILQSVLNSAVEGDKFAAMTVRD